MNENREEPCELLTWDSEFWGFPIARVRGRTLTPERLREIDRRCQARSIACLFFLATFDDPMTVRSAEQGQFHLVDTKVTLSRPTERLTPADPQQPLPWANVRLAVESDLEPLRRIASQCFVDSRFYFDHHFPRDKCSAFYERWVVESFNGFADLMLVADREGIPVGCLTYHLPANGELAARNGLLFVAVEARRRGVSRALQLAALDWLAERQVPMATTMTQGRNVAAQAAGQQCGFVPQRVELWYHKWYRPPTWTLP